ncbi:serine O-acetyltransferase [Aureibacter tunicatorum]|uniref:Serine O-acetyltransferase n=1 Tax=Aureibacter tunicatorum TaxID=866807 RepID=A0AAE3XIM9_9BACT|nr:serine acetyltransferase [Aureibacter tunicatorum]MDR6237408.1 serine O-acetyltransferase [Aureibacter tunicatorum]BDD06398.1 hypothetical protein AUTU_38810 [Aureibacter tunicatorum]
MHRSFIKKLYEEHRKSERMPYHTDICIFTERVFQLLFPQNSEQIFHSAEELEVYYYALENQLLSIFTKIQKQLPKPAEELTKAFMEKLPNIYDKLKKDAKAISMGDPAAQDLNQVIRTYPGFYGIAIYRMAHEMCLLDIPLLPRILTEFSHEKTGIDIHPAATIGEYFFIDHGTGIVIGGTAIIGDHVKIYQGVTLGALSVEKHMASMKRHPTIEDGVVIYAGATILGGNTVVGNNSVIGGNVWLTESVEPYTKVYHKAQVIKKVSKDESDAIHFSI